MNRGDIVKMLESEARRRPVVAELLSRAWSLSDEEIETADVPMKWFREGLREARNRAKQTMLADQIASYAAAHPETEDQATSVNLVNGMTVIYTGDVFYARSKGGGSLFEVRTGDLMFFPETGGAWINQTFFHPAPPQFRQFKIVEEQTRYQYVLAYAEYLLGKY
jgi:hypothetical protein